MHSYTLVLERTVDDKAFRLTLVTCMNKMAAKNVSLNREGSQRRFTMVDGLAASLSPFRWSMEQAKTPKCGAASFSFHFFLGWMHSLIVNSSAKEVVPLVAQPSYFVFVDFKKRRVRLMCLSMIHYNVSTVFLKKLHLPKLRCLLYFLILPFVFKINSSL